MSAAAVLSFDSSLADLLSPSQVNCWRGCQARWYYKYVLQLPDSGSAALALGISVDVAIKATWHNKLETGVDLPVERLIEIFAERWLQEAAKIEFGPKEDRDDLARRGARMIEIYMRDAEPAIHPRDVDLEVHGTIAGIHVRGYVDLIDITGMVIELKTAGATPNKICSNHAFQLATYAQLAPEIGDRMRVDTLVKLKSPKLVQIEHAIQLADYHFIRSSYSVAQEQMRSGVYDANRNSYLCTRDKCPYWRRCEAEYGGIVPGGEGDGE